MADDLDLNMDDDDLGLDEELDNLGDIDPFAEPPPPKNAREAISRSLKTGTSGFIDEITGDKLGAINDIAKSALPKTLSSESDAVVNVASNLKEELIKASTELRPVAKQTLDTIDRILPKDSILSRASNKLKSFLTGDDESKSTELSKEEQEQELINESINKTIGALKSKEETDELLNKQLEYNRYKSSIELSRRTAASLDLIRKFNNEVTASYYRRSLELQYKSLFISKEQLNILAKGMDTFKNQLESIILNTSLPDLVKTRKSELLGASIRGRMYSNITDSLYAEGGLLNTINKNISDKIGNIKSTLFGVAGGINNATGMTDMVLPGGKYGLAGMMLGGLAKSKLGEFIGKKISSDERANSVISKIKYAGSDLPGFLDEVQVSDDDSLVSKLKRKTLEFTKGIVGSGNTINSVSIDKENLNEAGLFDNRTKTSIIKVIPGLLSKIYSEIKSLRLKDDEPNKHELYYDYKNDRLDSVDNVTTNFKTSIAKKLKTNGMEPYLDSFIDNLVSYGGLELKDDYEYNQLRRAVVNYMVNGGSISPIKLLSRSFKNTLAPRIKSKVVKAITTLLKKAKKDPSIIDTIRDNLKNIKMSLSNVNSDVNELDKSGQLDQLSKLGLIKRDSSTGEVVFNNDKYRSLLVDSLSNRKYEDRNSGLETNTGTAAKDEKGITSKAKDWALNSKYGKLATDKANKLMKAKDKYAKDAKFKKPAIDKFNKFKKSYLEKGAIKATKEQYENIKKEFLDSDLYKDGVIKNVDEYAELLNINIPKSIKIKSFSKHKDDTSKSNDDNKKSKFFNASKMPGASMIGGLISSVKSKLFVNKSKANSKLFDADGDGDRDGNWKDRLSRFKKKTKDKIFKVTDKGKGGSTSNWGLLLGAIGTIASLATRMVKGIFKIPKLLYNISKTLLKLPLSIGKGIFNIIKLLAKPGLGLTKTLGYAGKIVTGGAKALWSGAKSLFNLGTKNVKNMAKGGASLFKATGAASNVLKSGASTATKVAGAATKTAGKAAGTASKVAGAATKGAVKSAIAKIGVKGGAKLAAKLATRAIPFLGWGLAAWDAANIAKLMIVDGKSLKSAASEQMLGVDITDDADKPTPTGEEDIKTPPKQKTHVSADKKIAMRPGPLADPTLENVVPANKKVDIVNLKPSFKSNLGMMANEYNDLTGKKIIINSGYRSKEYQAKLRAKYGSKAAKPGHSLHEFGLAFDTNTSIANELDDLGLMKKYGFTRPVGKETWHVEPAGIQHAIQESKKDPKLADSLVANSIGIGGKGWALVKNAKRYSRNKQYQLELTKASPDTKESKRTTKIIKLAKKNDVYKNNVINKPLANNNNIKVNKPLPNDDVVGKPLSTGETAEKLGKLKAKQDEARSIDKYKITSVTSVSKPIQNLNNIVTTSNKILNSIDYSMRESVDIQKKILEVINNMVNNNDDTVIETTTVDKTKTTDNQLNRRTELPKPIVSLERTTTFPGI